MLLGAAADDDDDDDDDGTASRATVRVKLSREIPSGATMMLRGWLVQEEFAGDDDVAPDYEEFRIEVQRRTLQTRSFVDRASA